MRFLISVVDHQTGTATREEMAAIGAFNEGLQQQGQWVMACGISPPAEAVVIDGRDGRAEVAQGPLHDAAEYLSGFWIVTASNVDAARALATEASRACNRRVELRPLLGE